MLIGFPSPDRDVRVVDRRRGVRQAGRSRCRSTSAPSALRGTVRTLWARVTSSQEFLARDARSTEIAPSLVLMPATIAVAVGAESEVCWLALAVTDSARSSKRSKLTVPPLVHSAQLAVGDAGGGHGRDAHASSPTNRITFFRAARVEVAVQQFVGVDGGAARNEPWRRWFGTSACWLFPVAGVCTRGEDEADRGDQAGDRVDFISGRGVLFRSGGLGRDAGDPCDAVAATTLQIVDIAPAMLRAAGVSGSLRCCVAPATRKRSRKSVWYCGTAGRAATRTRARLLYHEVAVAEVGAARRELPWLSRRNPPHGSAKLE